MFVLRWLLIQDSTYRFGKAVHAIGNSAALHALEVGRARLPDFRTVPPKTDN
jgi:hypothetical protein